MVIGRLRTFVVGMLVLGWLSNPSGTNAAIPELTESYKTEFEIMPADGSHPRRTPRRLANPRPVVIISRSEGLSDQLRQAYLRAALFGSLGVMGLIFIGWRSYGRRHGRAAR